MKRMVMVMALVALAACGGGGGGGGGKQDQNVLLQDDFSDTSTGWLGEGTASVTLEHTDIAIADGVLRMTAKADKGRGGIDTTGLTVPNASELTSAGDVRIEVTATKILNPPDNFYAVTCRQQDFDNFYGFAVVENGSFSIFKYENGIADPLTQDQSPLLSGSVPARNTITVECVGPKLTMSIDGTVVGSATDDTFSSGAIGIYVETRGTSGLVVEFDNLTISRVTG